MQQNDECLAELMGLAGVNAQVRANMFLGSSIGAEDGARSRQRRRISYDAGEKRTDILATVGIGNNRKSVLARRPE